MVSTTAGTQIGVSSNTSTPEQGLTQSADDTNSATPTAEDQKPKNPACPWVKSGAIAPRLDRLMAEMSLEDKLGLVHGSAKPLQPYGPAYAGQIKENKRLCIPALSLSDGPAGVGNDSRNVTQFPAPIALGATFDRDLARAFGEAIGKENHQKGAQVLLGPGLDVIRDPRWGRAFESFGEDPELVADIGLQVMQGIQAQKSLATAKHLAVYNQETGRNTSASNARIELRPMHEVYLLPFYKVVKGGVASVMCGYNPVNGVHACNNHYLMNQVLKGQMGFEGFVVSDWFGVHASYSSVNAGLDLQMPDKCFFDKRLRNALVEGHVAPARLDDMVRRILRPMFEHGVFDQHEPIGDPNAKVNGPEHRALAQKLAERSMVLLKNEKGLLPISATKIKRIAVIGEAAGRKVVTSGGGSAHVTADRVVTPLSGITARALEAGIEVDYHDAGLHGPAVELAKTADLAIVVVRHHKTESKDDSNLLLRHWDQRLIELVFAANPNTLVVLNTGAILDPSFDKGVPGLIAAWYPGEAYGHALAALLFGDAEPSGRLPMTVPLKEEDLPTYERKRFPGGEYSEGMLVGYKNYDAHNKKVAYPFGYGLSYTSFAYRNLVVQADGKGGFGLRFVVENTGRRSGWAVPQLYVDGALEKDQAPRALKDFASVNIEAGMSKKVELRLEGLDLSHFDETAQRWRQGGRTRRVWIGESSRDLRLETQIEVPEIGWTSQAVPAAKKGAPQGNAQSDESAGDRFYCPNEGFMAWGLGLASHFGLAEKDMAWEKVSDNP